MKTTETMTIQNAIQILTNVKGEYQGTFVATPSGDLIQDIMFENDMGKTYHKFDNTIVEESNLIPLAQYYSKN